MTHPGTELVALVTGDLDATERARVTAHLEGCESCRRAAEDYRLLLDRLARTAPEPPALHWGRFQADLRGRLEARRTRSWLGPGWSRSLQGALSLGLAILLLAVSIQSGGRRGPSDPGGPAGAAIDARVLGSRFDLLRQYTLVERLDLLENLDVIGRLDQLDPAGES